MEDQLQQYDNELERASQWHSVSSSNVAAIRYDGNDNTLYVRFNSGAVYPYFNVPFSVFKGFLEAPSKGKFLHWAIKPNYATKTGGL